jgi:hypothetical protein
MKEYLFSKGFVHVGSCGCKSNMQRYQNLNPNWHGYEVWIDLLETRFQCRRFYTDVDSKIIDNGYGNSNNYQFIFETYFEAKIKK